jgi:hypothetical protein
MTGAPIDLGDVRLRRDVDQLHRLGPRAVYELLAEIGRDRLLRVYVERLVARYAALDPGVVASLGADRLPRGWQ